MTRCPEFYEKLERDGNFCGLSPSEVTRIKAYRELVDKISKQGIDRTLIYEHFPAGAAREITALKDDELRIKGLNYVVACLKRNEKITAGDLLKTLEGFREESGSRSKKLPFGKKGTHPTPESAKEPRTEKPPMGQVKRPLPVERPPDAPPAPLAAQLKERYAPVQNPPPNVANVGNVLNVEKPPCQEGEPCPAPNGRDHLVRQQVLGNKCDLTGSLVRNLTVCPIIQRQRAAEANGAVFTSAGQVRAPADERAPRELPRSTQAAPRQVVITFSEKQWNILKQIQREDLADSFENAVKYLVNEAGERMEGA
jgi:hypothetical protein